MDMDRGYNQKKKSKPDSTFLIPIYTGIEKGLGGILKSSELIEENLELIGIVLALVIIVGIIAIIVFPATILVIGIGISLLGLLLITAVLIYFAVKKSIRCKKGKLSHVLAFLFAPFWLAYHYLISDNTDCV